MEKTVEVVSDGITWTAVGDYTAPEPQTLHYPGEKESFDLEKVLHKGEDLSECIDQYTFDGIQDEALKALSQERKESRRVS